VRINLIISAFYLFLITSLIILIVPVFSNHPVGEPELEKLQLWLECCRDADCVSMPFERIFVRQDKTLTHTLYESAWVDNEKFHPVPSQHHWVCYFDRNGDFIDENLRCLLYPQQQPLAGDSGPVLSELPNDNFS